MVREDRGIYRAREDKKYEILVRVGTNILKGNIKPDKKEIYTLAKELMSKNYLPTSILGAKLYEEIGKGEEAIPNLMKATSKSRENEGFSKKDIDEVSQFIKKNTKDKYVLGFGDESIVLVDKKTGLEKRLGIFLGLLAGGFGLSMLSLNLTGNVAGSLAQPKSIVGIILLVLGVVGAFFYFKRR